MSEKDIKAIGGDEAVDDLSVADGTIDDLSVADVMANVEKRVADGNVDDKRLADMMAEFDRHSNVGVPGVTEMPRRRNVTQTTRISTLTSYVLNNVPEEVLNFDIVDFYRTIILNLKYDQKKKSEIVEFLRNLFFIEGTKGGNIRIYIKDPNLILEAYERISDNANVDLWEGLFKDNKDTIFSYFIEKKVFGVFKAGPSISGPLSEVARFSELDADLIVESPYIDGLDAYTRYSFVIMALEEDDYLFPNLGSLMKSARNEKLNLGEKFDVGTFASALYVILARKGIDANVLFDEKDPSKFKALQNFLNFSNLTSADMDFIVEEVYKTFPDDFKIHTNKIEKSAVLVDMLFVKFNGRIPKHTLSLLVSTVFNQIVKDRKDHSLKTSIEVNDIFNDVLSKFPILFSITYLLSISKVDRSNVYMKWYSLINNNTEDTLLKIEEILLNSGGKSFDKNHLIAFLADYPSNLNDRSLEDFEFYNFSIKLAENIRDVAPKPTQQKLIVDPMKLDFQAETMIADQTHLQRTIVISGDSPDAYQALQGSTLKVAKNPSFIGTVLKVFGIKTKKK